MSDLIIYFFEETDKLGFEKQINNNNVIFTNLKKGPKYHNMDAIVITCDFNMNRSTIECKNKFVNFFRLLKEKFNDNILDRIFILFYNYNYSNFRTKLKEYNPINNIETYNKNYIEHLMQYIEFQNEFLLLRKESLVSNIRSYFSEVYDLELFKKMKFLLGDSMNNLGKENYKVMTIPNKNIIPYKLKNDINLKRFLEENIMDQNWQIKLIEEIKKEEYNDSYKEYLKSRLCDCTIS